ncbi:hypothetical protein Ae201684P_007013 [Aphanomyces euteiches]|nr:hypothetical protein Ae201684P_007013 [Aphanomyces euteiches]
MNVQRAVTSSRDERLFADGGRCQVNGDPSNFRKAKTPRVGTAGLKSMSDDVSNVSKTKTPRVSTASAASRRSFIAVIAEGKSREVAICGMDLSAPHEIYISTMVDTHNFVETISLLDMYQPSEILFVETKQIRRLHDEIKNRVKNTMCRIVPIARKYFDQVKGADDLKRIAMNCIDMSLLKNYVVMGSVACLVKYVEFIQGIYIAKKTIKVIVNTAVPVLLMDYNTISALEVMRGARSGSTHQSLVAKIDSTFTSLLRPYADTKTIEDRQELVGIFLSNPSSYLDITEILPDFPDLEQLMSQLVVIPKTVSQCVFEQAITSIIALKTTLEATPKLRTRLSCLNKQLTQKSNLLRSLIESLDQNDFGQILISIEKVIDHSYVRAFTGGFAVKSGIDGKLDVMRSTLVDTVGTMEHKISEYQEKFGFTIKLHFSVSRGYHLNIPNAGQVLPSCFEERVKYKRSIACTTKEFSSLNSRAFECLQDIYKLSFGVVQALLDEVRPHASVLYSMVENIAVLDMILSFTNLAALSPADQPYCCPTVSEHGQLFIKKGRHPLIEEMMSDQPFVPNDLYMSPVVNFNLVTGPNCSGKSTYLRTVAVITVLAHIGCYVPAEEAHIPIRDRLFTRMGTFDDMQENASSFTLEMQEAAFILDNCTRRSLVLVDELGRGTSNEEGFAIAWSISESLMKTEAYCLFSTHFHGLRELSKLYICCQNYHLEATDEDILHFQYKLEEGPTNFRHGYGLKMARVCGLPQNICDEAAQFHQTISQREENLIAEEDDNSLQHLLIRRLIALVNANLDDNALRVELQHLRDQFVLE